MHGRIYLLSATKAAPLVPMEEGLYDSENLLQELLASYPELLAGDQINANDPRRWILITREMGVPGEEGGSGRWALDHLFIDQDAVPTLVEVKRSTDTRIRREVVGQMLDYAANAVVHWPVEEIRARFLARCESDNEAPEELLEELLGEDEDIDEFWQRVKTNLQAGRIRIVFVADVIPPELRRVIEFLNMQMDPTEVIGVEVRKFAGEGMTTLVPQVVGQTESARARRSGSGNPSQRQRPTNEAAFLEAFQSRHTPGETEVARQLLEWARSRRFDLRFSEGSKGINFIPQVSIAGATICPVAIVGRGLVRIQMLWLKQHAPFDSESKRVELYERIKDIPGLMMAKQGMEGFPKAPIKSLQDPAVMAQVLESLDWIIAEVRSHQ